MSKKKNRATKRSPILTKDLLFSIQLFVGLIVFFSIYFHGLMGPFGLLIQNCGLFFFGDALMLLPWLLFATSPILIRSNDISIQRYGVYLSIFCVSFLFFSNSFFNQDALTLHGEISFVLAAEFIQLGAKLFGDFGVRFFCFSLSIIFGVLLFELSFSSLIQSFRLKPKGLISDLLKKMKYMLFYTPVRPVKKKYKKSSLQIKKDKDELALKKIKDAPIKPIKMDVFNAQNVSFEDPVIEKKSATNSTVTDALDLGEGKIQPDYVLPPLDLLAKPRTANVKQIEQDMRSKAQILEMTLESFNVKASVVNVTIGPSVSRFELQPGDGVKISKITNLTQDIALKLAVPMVRIEAPIPGKALVGIEVPNADIAPLNLRSIIDPKTFLNSGNPLDCILGQRITGEGVTMNLNKMPHILVAGSTGSGKSVCINTIILSILMKATPDEVKFLMIDPKKVELSLYADIPHLLAPVVTNPHKAAATIKQWALAEMERRYELFTEYGVKDLAGFNSLAASGEHPQIKPIPYIVVIIDEFADLMMVASQEVENAICRLAQMARATGIHLVIATQRPSVNVVTGLIKANVPSRISFAVQSQIDSRTVLDMVGAEKLLGRGDMLYMPVGASKPDRVQGVFVSEKEVNAVVKFIKDQGGPNYVDEIMDVEPINENDESSASEDSDRDVLFDQAKEMIQSTQYASTSYLQRKLRIGYNRAARLMDELEDAGVIGAYDGETKTRPVINS
ncbi:MAG: DNA translocase FtsK [Candidatus Margulisiibacteriota bacterium]